MVAVWSVMLSKEKGPRQNICLTAAVQVWNALLSNGKQCYSSEYYPILP